MSRQISVTGKVSSKLDKRTLANQLLSENLRKKVLEIRPQFDFDSWLDPKLTPKEATDELSERYDIYLSRYDDRPKGPNGEVCNGSTICLFCVSEVPYNRRSRLFCDNNNRCKMKYHRKKQKTGEAEQKTP